MTAFIEVYSIARHAAQRPFSRGERITLLRGGIRHSAEIISAGQGLTVLLDTGQRATLHCGEYIARSAQEVAA